MVKIMFVCHGNICRSPMAEIIFRSLAEKHGAAEHYLIASSATSSEEIWNGVGNPVYPPAQEVLKKHGLSAGSKRAVQLRKHDYDSYDLFIGMDSNNIRNMLHIFGGDPDEKVRRLLPSDVQDPWYTGNFDTVFREIYEGCQTLLETLEENKSWSDR